MTNPLIRLVFGIQALDEKSTRLIITSSSPLATPPPPLAGLRRSDGGTFTVAYAQNAWTVELAPDDYVLRIETEAWAAASIAIAVDLQEDSVTPRFVYWGMIDPSTEGIAGWRASEATVDPPATSMTSNPKDPWPPPPPPDKRSTITPTAALTWFTDQLDPLWDQTSTDQRDGAPGSGGAPPPRRRVA